MKNIPLVTVIMPIRNEQGYIEKSLTSVLLQDYPSNFLEIIVADGLSDDDTLACVQQVDTACRVRIIENPRLVQAAGLNEGIKVARGEIIVRVDGHVVIAPNYLRTCVQLLQESGAANVGGNMQAVGVTAIGKAIAVAINSGVAVPSAFHFSHIAQFTDTVYLGAWKRQTLLSLGGFNEQVGVNEDYELNYRVRKAHGKVLLSPLLHSEYYGRETISSLSRQFRRYGWSRVQTLRLHPRSLRIRHLVTPLLLAAVVGGLLPMLLNRWVFLIWLSVVELYLGFVLTISMMMTRHHTQVKTTNLFLVIIVIHLTWAVGFYEGLVGRKFPS